ncbi:MAG: biosynthetic-type acetolactate synthase large subunit [Oscillospiraceae bacterium]|nr:biosynthetic-type acetolactate synthase large subunit [Oscillospiraceae bacterium]
MQRTGAEILMECLLEQGVDTIFGYPGGRIMPVYDALYAYSDRIAHILTAHEQGASHAADGYARSSGKVGVCFATSGPGATNLVTGIATAYMDSSPVVFITANVNEALIGKDSFQEVDIVGITMPITKCNYLVRDVDTLADVVREAFAVARGGRPGPVLIDLLYDVTVAKAEYQPLPREKHHESGRLLLRKLAHAFDEPTPDSGDIDYLVDMIAKAKKPLVICGGGVVRSEAADEFRAFIEKIDAPTAITVMGAGAIPGRHELATGMIGMHGTLQSNHACDRCDLLIAVGCRFSDRVGLNFETFAQNAEIVQIDIDRSEIDKNIKTDHHIIGDAKKVLSILNNKVIQKDNQAWKDEVFAFCKESPAADRGDGLTPKQILTTIAEILPQRTIVATDVGQHQMWSIQHFFFDYPGQLLTSGGFGTMGFGLGAAIGAKAAHPEQTVLHITGDGCFRMNCHELSTEAHYKLPIITCVFNNGVLGMVRQWQNVLFGKRFSQTTLDRGPDFVKLAEAYDLLGLRASTAEEFADALQQAQTSVTLGRGVVIDCILDQDEMVTPMVGSGKHITEFLIE